MLTKFYTVEAHEMKDNKWPRIHYFNYKHTFIGYIYILRMDQTLSYYTAITLNSSLQTGHSDSPKKRGIGHARELLLDSDVTLQAETQKRQTLY